MGVGPSCQLYQDGLDAQRRSYAFIGVTSALAAGTAVVGVFLTQWSAPPPTATVRGVTVTPTIGIGNVALEGSF